MDVILGKRNIAHNKQSGNMHLGRRIIFKGMNLRRKNTFRVTWDVEGLLPSAMIDSKLRSFAWHFTPVTGPSLTLTVTVHMPAHKNKERSGPIFRAG